MFIFNRLLQEVQSDSDSETLTPRTHTHTTHPSIKHRWVRAGIFRWINPLICGWLTCCAVMGRSFFPFWPQKNSKHEIWGKWEHLVVIRLYCSQNLLYTFLIKWYAQFVVHSVDFKKLTHHLLQIFKGCATFPCHMRVIDVFCFLLMEKSPNLENLQSTMWTIPLEQVSVLQISNINVKSSRVSKETELFYCLTTVVA